MVDFYLKTKYLFGEGSLNGIISELKNKNYKKGLILYGKGSVKKNGILDSLKNILNEINLDFVEFKGIEPNPRSTTIDKCVNFCRENNVDIIFALGGGSVVDASKVIGVLINNRNYDNCWDYVLDPINAIEKSVDIVSIITLAGTGSENNAGSVITNSHTNQKKGVMSPTAIPFLAIEDPTYTYTVNEWQTASGIFDCFSHLLEQYFGKNTFFWTQEYIFANLRVLIKYAKVALSKPDSYEARENILWTTSMSLNGLASFNSDSDWDVHVLEHAFSGLWDITHGAGLALITPYYIEVKSQKDRWFKDKVIELGRNVFKTNTFESTMGFLINFIKSINLPLNWSKFENIKDFTNNDVEFLVEHSCKFGNYCNENLYREVILKIKEQK